VGTWGELNNVVALVALFQTPAYQNLTNKLSKTSRFITWYTNIKYCRHTVNFH